MHARRLCLFFCALLWVPSVLAQTFDLNHASLTVPELKIARVSIGADSTTIEFRCTAKRNMNFGVYPPGHDMAYYLTDVGSTRRFQLLDAQEIPIRPLGKMLKPGESITYRLVFEKLTVRKFHVVEGKTPPPSSMPAHFTNVTLQ